MSKRPAKKRVVEALDAIRDIQRPAGDNDGDPINAPNVYNDLSVEDQRKVDEAENLAKVYTRTLGDYGEKPNKRSITELRKAEFDPHLTQGNDESFRLHGNLTVGDWKLDIGDPKSYTPE